MIDLHYAATPNGLKIKLFLEETGLPYRIVPVNIGTGEQFEPDFLAISPNNKIPAIVDRTPADGGAPVSVFESGAILQYLAEKTGQLLPADPRRRIEAMQWLFWQMAGLGPMSGQLGHFAFYAPEPIAYALDRYGKEVRRLYSVMDRRLAEQEFLAGDYSIADIASYPWLVPHTSYGIDLAGHPNLKRWFDAIAARPASQRTYEGVETSYSRSAAKLDDEARRILFGGHAGR